jgi:transmembrane sensor
MKTISMCKSDYTVEDFVLDPDFKQWVLNPDAETKIYWEEYLKRNPSKNQEILLARKILLNLSRNIDFVSEARIKDAWSIIDRATDSIDKSELEAGVIPITTQSTLNKYISLPSTYSKYSQMLRVAAILAIAFLLAFTAEFITRQEKELLAEIPLEYENYIAPAGVKSQLTLWDGTKVILNSGSSIKYIKNFEPNQREIELIGEAFFDVTKDPTRPFIVKTKHLSTRVLGTSFNVKAFEDEDLVVSLLTGKVEIIVNSDTPETVSLMPGEAISYKPEGQKLKKGGFDSRKILAWTQKIIVFDQTPMGEIKRVLENWYGVKIQFINQPSRDLEITARFNDQSLKDVLEGLSYSARFEFEIQEEKVVIKFK